MSIITLSRQMGAGAEEIDDMICQELGYTSIDKQHIGEVVTGYGFQYASLEKYDEKKPSFWNFISREHDRLFHAVRIAICHLARKGNVIIIGRGGYILLRDIPGVLRIKVIAPFESRVRNMAQAGKSPSDIEDLLRHSDREREGFLRHYYRADWNNPFLFDMVINTEKTPYHEAARLIIETCRFLDKRISVAEVQERLTDLTIKLKVEQAVMEDAEALIRNLTVEVKGGKVLIFGIVSDAEAKKTCEEAALRVEGVKELDSRIAVTAAPTRLGD